MRDFPNYFDEDWADSWKSFDEKYNVDTEYYYHSMLKDVYHHFNEDDDVKRINTDKIINNDEQLIRITEEILNTSSLAAHKLKYLQIVNENKCIMNMRNLLEMDYNNCTRENIKIVNDYSRKTNIFHFGMCVASIFIIFGVFFEFIFIALAGMMIIIFLIYNNQRINRLWEFSPEMDKSSENHIDDNSGYGRN